MGRQAPVTTRCRCCYALLFRAYIPGRGYVFRHYAGGRKRCDRIRQERATK